MRWEYRVLKLVNADGEWCHEIHEVYYIDSKLAAYTEPAEEASSDSVDDLREMLDLMREALDKPFLVKEDFDETILPRLSLEARQESVGTAPVSTSDFMASLERQETDQRDCDFNEGVLVPAAKLATRLKMTPQGLRHALKAKRIFTLQGPSGEQVYPAFFADPKQDRKMLEKVSKALGDLPGAAKWDFFMSPRVSLGKRTPLEALANGKFEAVMVAANVFVEE